MRRPRLLDLYCCQGGASAGYAAAGFDVVGVDIDPQPRYPYTFVRAGVLEYLAAVSWQTTPDFDLIHASPPCQRYSKAQRIQGRDHPDLIGPTREALKRIGLPYVIENVEDARGELRDPVTLCGAMFGLRTYRHRLFEFGGGAQFEPPAHPEHTAPLAKMGRPPRDGEFMHVVGNFSAVWLARSEAVMGMPWANRDGLREAIPPAYTEYIGRQLLTRREQATAAVP